MPPPRWRGMKTRIIKPGKRIARCRDYAITEGGHLQKVYKRHTMTSARVATYLHNHHSTPREHQETFSGKTDMSR